MLSRQSLELIGVHEREERENFPLWHPLWLGGDGAT